MFFFGAAGEYQILLVHLDQFRRVADAMGAGGAGGGDGVIHAADAEGRGETGGNRAAHGARHPVGPNPADAAFAHDVKGFELILRRAAAGAHNDADAIIGNLVRLQTGIGLRLFHRDVAVGGSLAHETQELAVDPRLQIDINARADLGAHAHFGVFGIEFDAAAALPQRLQHCGLVVAQTGNHPDSGHYDASHKVLWIRPY